MITGAATKSGIVGWPVEHSRSPRLHGWWLQLYGVDGVYVPLPVQPADLETAIRALPKLGFAGCNVTLPHKQAMLRVVDEIDPVAERIGAINTVVVGPDGRLTGSNTDAFGFIEALREAAPNWRPTGPCVVLGAGGAARAVVVALLDAGASELRLLNRTRAKAEALAALDPRVAVIDWRERAAALADAALLVNTTSLGMIGNDELDLTLDDLPSTALVNDIVYTPLYTSLLDRAMARGNRIVDGLGMLLHQARPGFAAWFGVQPAVSADQRHYVLEQD
ncbi:MAG: shikimate dehydrogenase [Alphaproteobacteria bacterium]